jgi:folate-binding protein YgfZ
MDTAAETRPDSPLRGDAPLVVDRSERGKLALSGDGAIEFLNGQVTNELVGLPVGNGRYAAFLNHKGGMLGDVRILHAVDPGAPELGPLLLLDTERSALQALFDMIREFKVGFDVELHKRTLERAIVGLVGEHADALLDAVPGRDELDCTPAQVAGVPVLAIRTALGIDLYCEQAGREPLIAALEAAGARAGEEQAAELARIELGRPVFGVDIPVGTIPQEAGLNDRAVSFTKGCYVGQETVARLFYKGTPKRHLRGLRASEPLTLGATVSLEGRELGTVTSAAVSPEIGPIALALLRKEAAPGTTVELSPGARATVVELPFTGPEAPHR